MSGSDEITDYKTLSSTIDRDGGLESKTKTAESREMDILVENLNKPSDFSEGKGATSTRKTVTYPDGRKTVSITDNETVSKTIMPDGVEILNTSEVDAGSLINQDNTMVSTTTIPYDPSILSQIVLQQTTSLDYTLSDPNDQFSDVDSLVTNSNLNGRYGTTSTLTSTVNGFELVSTSAEGRKTKTLYDEYMRPVESFILDGNNQPVFHATFFEYDSTGRPSKTIQAATKNESVASNRRMTTYSYYDTSDDQNGLLKRVTGNDGRYSEFEHDAVGRPEITELYDSSATRVKRLVNDYDLNRNLDSVLPPGRTQTHDFEYNNNDYPISYTPPMYPDPDQPSQTIATSSALTYNLDRQATTTPH
ncbi:MAG: hypothetical protein ACFCU1_12465 [Sumerlaeia bacterium]